MNNPKDLTYQTPEDLGLNNPRRLPPGVYLCKDSKDQLLFRRWTGVAWSLGVKDLLQVQQDPEEFIHHKEGGVRILGWYAKKD